MRFCVSVPVLSQQIVVVEPSVSTAGRWRTSALRLAMRCVAMASESVTVGSRPSGTLATMMPMANSRFAQIGKPHGLTDEEQRHAHARGERRHDAGKARNFTLQR